MNRVLFVSLPVLLMFVTFLGNCFAEDISSRSTVSRAAIDKKYAFIEKQLQPRVKRKLSSVTDKFNQTVKKTVINNNAYTVKAGETIYLKADNPAEWINTGSDTARLLWIKIR